MNDIKICPLIMTHVPPNTREFLLEHVCDCIRDRCAWWVKGEMIDGKETEGSCAIKRIAEKL
jgi:hypothetical protein